MALVDDLAARFPEAGLTVEPTADPWPTVRVPADHVRAVLTHLSREIEQPYRMLHDLTCIDERERSHGPDHDFTLVYHLLSFDRNADVRLKVPLRGAFPTARSITDLWPNADWYEREVFDMFGVRFDGHPDLRRILMPPGWKGHPLRREHPIRATEMGPYTLPPEERDEAMEALRYDPDRAQVATHTTDGGERLILNLGPQHPGTHGVLRLILVLDGESVVHVEPDIGYHHRAAEKMGERQSWHTYVPYTDRIDYMAGLQNELPYVLAVERLAGIQVPPRAQVIRVMMAELFRVISHLVWYGTFAQDVGQLSTVFYTFNDRERAFDIVEAVTGGRMHPAWFRIGGVAADLPQGWDGMFRDFLAYMPKRLREYDDIVLRNQIFRARTVGIGHCSRDDAIAWGMTGPMLRATGLEWDLRKMRPYSSYDQFDFDVPTFDGSDCYARALVRVEEIRQSLRILAQCVENMPSGAYKTELSGGAPPDKSGTLRDIETLIHHFIGVSWGPVVPPGEASFTTEAPKGHNTYYIVSDGGTGAYRLRIRTPSFAHMQAVPMLSKGGTVQDLVATLGSIDFVLADVDR